MFSRILQSLCPPARLYLKVVTIILFVPLLVAILTKVLKNGSVDIMRAFETFAYGFVGVIILTWIFNYLCSIGMTNIAWIGCTVILAFAVIGLIKYLNQSFKFM